MGGGRFCWIGWSSSLGRGKRSWRRRNRRRVEHPSARSILPYLHHHHPHHRFHLHLPLPPHHPRPLPLENNPNLPSHHPLSPSLAQSTTPLSHPPASLTVTNKSIANSSPTSPSSPSISVESNPQVNGLPSNSPLTQPTDQPSTTLSTQSRIFLAFASNLHLATAN